LHSAQLAFIHPRSGERLEFTSPLPQELNRLLLQIATQDSSGSR
jgi:23S rRNA pseudouridine1911/1915/1917 synthase